MIRCTSLTSRGGSVFWAGELLGEQDAGVRLNVNWYGVTYARGVVDDMQHRNIPLCARLLSGKPAEAIADAVEKTDAGVIFLAKAAAAEQLLTPLSEEGVLLVTKPFSNTFFLQAIHMAAASNHRLLLLRQENQRMQEKLAQVRLVSRAKCCLIELGRMTEAEAHRYIEKKAMDTRRDRAEVAQEILDSYDPAQ